LNLNPMKNQQSNILTVHHEDDNSICRLDHGAAFSIPAHLISGMCAYDVGALLKITCLESAALTAFIREQESLYPRPFDGALVRFGELGYVHRFNVEGKSHYVINVTPCSREHALSEFAAENGGAL